MKKLLAMVLAVCMAMSCMALAVSAAENVLTVGGSVTPSERAEYTFTPAEAGTYVIYSTGGEGYIDVYSGDSVVAWGDRAVFQAEANEVFNVLLYPSGETDTFKAEKAVAPTSISLSETSWTGYVGTYQEFELTYAPVNGYSPISTVEVSDEAIVSAGVYDNWVGVDLNAAGAASVTVTTANGKSATVQVTVKSAEQLKLNETKTAAFADGQQVVYTFTPAKTGVYTFKFTGSENSYMSLDCDDTFEHLDGGISFKAEANVPVRLTARAYYEDTYSVTVSEGNQPEAISFTENTPDVVYVGQDVIWFEVETETEDAYIGQVEWTVSDSAYLSIDGYGTEAWATPLKAGTVTVKATAENGKTASKTVTVKNPLVIKCGEEKTVTEATLFEFTPTETAEYVVYSEAWANVTDAEGMYISRKDLISDSYQWACAFEMTAGTTYLIDAEGWDEGTVVGVDKMVEDTDLYISGDGYWTVGNYAYLEITVDGFAYAETVGEWTWKSSNSSVAEIVNQYDTGCQLECKKEGKTTITATNAEGKKLTYVLEVMGMSDMIEQMYSTHKITSGGNAVMVENAIKDHTITIEGNADELLGIAIVKNAGDKIDEDELMDENKQVSIMAEDLTVKQNGSKFTVTIPGKKIQELGIGKHQMIFVMYTGDMGGGAMTSLTVKAVDATNPPTGDTSLVVTAVIVMICAVMGMGVVLYTSRKKAL